MYPEVPFRYRELFHCILTSLSGTRSCLPVTAGVLMYPDITLRYTELFAGDCRCFNVS